MLIVQLRSGLGNQLFILAFSKYIEQVTNRNVIFDLHSYENDKSRCPEIEIVNPYYTSNSYDPLIPFGKSGLIKILCNIAFSLNIKKVLINDCPEFDPSILDMNSQLKYYFKGYWQTNYYVDRLKNVDEIFKPKMDIPSSIIKYFNSILSDNVSVSVHIRRGDYVNKYAKNYNVCTIDYFNRAINFINNMYPKISFYVFSDEIEWAKKNISAFNKDNKVIFVENYNINSYWYIHLMSLCKHNIISNSSFSWWGAYLNKNNSKIVICPSIWRHDSDETIALNYWHKIDS